MWMSRQADPDIGLHSYVICTRSESIQMKRRCFIQKCAAVGAAAGMTSRNVLGATSNNANDSNIVDNSSIAGVWKTLKPGEVKAISGPGTDAPNTMSNVMYLTSAGEGSRNGGSYFGNWCSGTYARHDGALGAMVFSNGGDADYWGNEVYKFSIDTRVWSRECARSAAMNGRTKAGDDPNFDETWENIQRLEVRYCLNRVFRTVMIR